MEASVSCERRINMQCLVGGYSRENTLLFVPSSVLDVISYYYPSMNGHTFIWKIKNNEELMSSKSNVLDSDVFDVGVPNKFFLRLQSNLAVTQSRDYQIGSRGYQRGRRVHRGRRGSYRGRRGGYPRDHRRTYCINNIYYNDDIPPQDQQEQKQQEYDKRTLNKNLVLSLMSFPLPTSYHNQTIHVELYLYEINAEYSTIWNQTAYDHRDPHRSYNDYDDYDDRDYYNDEFSEFDNISGHDTYIQHGWVINVNLNELKELTFECKINILQNIFRNPYNQRGIRGYRGYRGRGGYGYDYYGGRGGYVRYGGGPPHNMEEKENKKIKPYNYTALSSLLNGSKNKMKFVWNIVDKSIIDKLTGHSNFKGIIQFHSDVYYDMFQLQIGRENNDSVIDKNYFQIQICGLPANTDKMGVKLELFAMDIKNTKNRIQIMSNIVTFSYDSPLYIVSDDKIETLTDLLVQCKNLSLLCVVNINHKYDESGNTVKDEIKLPASNDDNNDEEIIKKDDNKTNNTNNSEVAIWLRDMVGLSEYNDIFIEHGVDDIETVKLLTLDLITTMGINKVGHQIKLLHQIEQLKPINCNNIDHATNNTKTQWIIIVSVCVLCLCFLYQFYFA